MKLGPALVAEAIGAFGLSFLGILAIHAGVGGLVGVALAHGLALGIGITAFAAVSGGHLNPAVTIGLLAGGQIKPGPALAYIVAQVLGGFLAGMAVIAVLGADGGKAVVDGTPAFAVSSASSISVLGACLAEMIATFFLVTAVWGTAGVDPRSPKIGGLGVGLIVVADILAIGPLTGAAMNPSRATGPALASLVMHGDYHWANHWIYWVGPVVGGILASVIYKGLMMPKDVA